MLEETTCRNCGAALDGRFCRLCGQDRTLVLRPLREMVAEWADAVLGWDTRAGRTLRALCFEPGRLTVEFAAGHRAAWLHPLRLYLGVSIVALAVFSGTTGAIVARITEQLGAIDDLGHMGQLMLLISTALFVLLPVHAATYAVAFRSARRFYVEHLVFVLHCTTFVFIVQALASLLQYLCVRLDAPYVLLVLIRLSAHAAVVGYGWFAARRVYGLGRWQTLVWLATALALFFPVFAGSVWLLHELKS